MNPINFFNQPMYYDYVFIPGGYYKLSNLQWFKSNDDKNAIVIANQVYENNCGGLVTKEGKVLKLYGY